jgi:amino acid adenylation domain-containing protein/non-ribosomal peptide synthase protein (TIGR01720 family)
MDSWPRDDLLGRSNLTKGQWLLWLGQQLQPDSPLYNMAFTFVIDGEVDPERFRAAFALLVERCDALRTVVVSTDGIPRQEVLPSLGHELPVIDLSGETDPEAAFAALGQARCEEPLDIKKRMFDAALVKISRCRFGWFLNQHHVVSDAWSAGVQYEWLRTVYAQLREGGSADLPDLPAYASYRSYEAEQRARAELHPHWQSRRHGPESSWGLYGRKPARSATGNERIRCDLGAERFAKLRALAERPEAAALTVDLSLFRLLATALFVFLYRVNGQDVTRIGALSHNRPSSAYKRTAGLFAELYPLQIEIAPDDSFVDVLVKVRTESDAYLRAALPGASDATANRSINTVLNFIRADFGPFDGAPVRATWLHPRHVDPEHHLRLHVHDFDQSGELQLDFDFNTGVFSPELRRDAIGHFLAVLDGMIADWDRPITSMPLGDPARASYLCGTDSRAAGTGDDQTVIGMFAERVADGPDDVAVVCGSHRMSYRELDRRTDDLARDLRARGIGPGALVGLCMRRSIGAVVSMLGSLKAGAAYVPIDPRWPQTRIALVLEDASIAVVLTARGDDAALPPALDRAFVSEDGEVPDSSIEREDAEPLAPDGVAYIMYTSGSTGRPKGVTIGHRALANYVTWAGGFYTAGRCLSFPLFSPLTFDLTVTSVFVPLATGGTIVVYPETDARADLTVLRVFDDDIVDIVKLTPSHLSLLADRDLSRSRVRQLILGGEDLPERVARRAWRQFGERVTIHNEYGPTEATVGCIVHTYDPRLDVGGSVPIGRPIAGMEAFVIDGGNNPVPAGVVGELAVRGAGVAERYHRRPELTSERFLRRPSPDAPPIYLTGDLARLRPDGELEYLGRRDDQVKVRGVRIELGEIEAAISEHTRVHRCVVGLFQGHEAPPDAAPVHCARCGLASSFPGVSFDEENVCNHCRDFDRYRDSAEGYFKSMNDLRSIFDESRRSHPAEYDCVALLSGGKDSTYVLCRLVDMGLRVLSFTLDNGYISEQAKANIRRVVETLGVDHVFGSTPAMNDIFVDSLERHANVCHGCFKTIYTLSVQLARQHGVPIIVTGLSRGQFFETRLTPELFTDLTVSVDEIDRIVLDARKAYHRIDDAVHRCLDVSMFDDDRVFNEVRFVDFYRYCDVALGDLLEYLDRRVPWVRPSDTGRSTNCLINDVGIYVHKRERGFHNYSLPYSWDVRMGHKTREAAMAELDDEIDVGSVQRILDDIGYTGEAAHPAGATRLAAYYVAAQEISAFELRRHLRARLPETLVPSRFVRLDAIPMTENGKVDRSALPHPDAIGRTRVETEFVAPRTHMQRTLCEIWEGVLGVERVGVDDNFFDLGGDSILAIQIVARAHRHGLRLTAGQLFDALTVANLAEVSGRTDDTAAAERAVGPTELTPVQHWFFGQDLPAPEHWNQAITVEIAGDVEEPTVRRALDTVVAHHDAFRMAFAKSGGSWRAWLESAQPAVELRLVDVSGLDPSGRLEITKQVERQLHASFDLGKPPLLRAALFAAPRERTELLLVAHHLVIDAVSFSVLLDDFDAVLGQLRRDETPILPGFAVGPTAWGNTLRSAAIAEPFRTQHSYWANVIARCGPGVPDEAVATTAADTIGNASVVSVTLDADRTRALLRDVPKRSRAKPNEVVLGAVLLAISDWTGERDIALILEAHGRESIGATPDLSRTVGWLTSQFPLVLHLPDGGAEPVDVVRAVRDQLRSVPDRGLGYGVLRYLDPDATRRERLDLDGRRHVLFNYLGDSDNSLTPGGLVRVVRGLRLDRDGGTPRPFAIDIDVMIVAGCLRIDWGHSPSRHQSSLIELRAASCLEHLKHIIDASVASSGEQVSSDDFPLANLDDEKLRKLSALLNRDSKRS